MSDAFQLFGAAHLCIVTAILLLAGLLVIWARHFPEHARFIRSGMGTVILVNELIWYAYNIYNGWFRFPDTLPLHLCDLTLWLTIISAFTLNPRCFELSYYFGLAGTSMAILTPDVWAPFPSYPTVQFFLAHGMIVATVLFMSWGKLCRPQPKSIVRAFIYLNIYTIVIALFNVIFDTNYMYLCQKPSGFSILNYFGPWPLYILISEFLALILFLLLWLPFRKATIQ